MNPAFRRFFITTIVLFAAIGVVIAIIVSPGRNKPGATPDQNASEQANADDAAANDDAAPPTDDTGDENEGDASASDGA